MTGKQRLVIEQKGVVADPAVWTGQSRENPILAEFNQDKLKTILLCADSKHITLIYKNYFQHF